MTGSRWSPDTSMPRYRLWLANGCIAFILAGSAYDVALQGEHWPFSSYPMYSAVERTRTLGVVRLFGVMADDSGRREVPLTDFDALQPLDQARVAAGLDWIIASTWGDDGKRHELLTRALADVLQRYETLRIEGRNDGPELSGIRMYRVFWQLDPWARNVDSPTRKDLLHEIVASESGTSGE